MADAQVPPQAGDAKANSPGETSDGETSEGSAGHDGTGRDGSVRRQGLRLSDAEDVAAVRLDMFGDPAVKEALAGLPARAGGAALPAAAGETTAGSQQAAEAADDAAEPAAPEPPSPEAPAPALPSPSEGLRFEVGLEDILVDSSARASTEHAAAPEQQPGAPLAEDSVAEAGDAPDAATGGDGDAAPPVAASDAPEAASGEQAPRERSTGTAPLGPFGALFMMPPGSPEQDSPDDMRTGLLEPPRFRDELMFVRDQDGVPITADSTILADLEPQPTGDEPPPASELLPPEPHFMEEPPETPAEDPPPAPPAFPMFSVQAPYPEAEADPGPGYGEAPPLPPDPAPPAQHPGFDAAARIVAEANATAAALENLERMLEQQLPYAHAASPAYSPDPFVERPHPPTPLADGLRLRVQGLEADPAPSSPFPAPLFPLPTRPPRSRRSVYLVGFLTGLVVSLLSGAVLLFFILYGRPG